MWFRALFLLLVVASFGFTAPDQAVKAISERSEDELLEGIEKGRKKLEKEWVQIIRDVVGTRRVKVGRRKYKEVPIVGIVGREMAIAILDSQGEIRVARGIKRDRGLEVLTPGFILAVRRDNGINSDISCISPPGGKVVAVKYPVTNEGQRFGPGPEVIEAIYTPFSPEIKNSKVIRLGLETQAEFIEEAYERLEKRKVYSRAFPGRRVVDVIPRDVLTILLLNEHIDPGLFRSSGLAKPLVEQVLTVIATNREQAYAYSISSAGARGLVQMIPSTYSLMLRNYPAAGLLSSFSRGMADPVNAVMAQVLLCDADWQSIRTRVDIPAERIGPYLAAAYNGGVGRVLNVLEHDEMEWMDEPESGRRPTMTVTRRVPVRVRTRRGRTTTKYVVRSYTQPIFRSETSKYVQQYHWIEDYLNASGLRWKD
ncbi:MAG TPA: hypothetical protein VNO70_17825 [Blastocatellia bacterium]|nr:hypothetical protein [Blastocatellia bacterium]